MREAWPAGRQGYFTPPVLIILAILIFAVAILIALNTDLVKRLKKEPAPTPSQTPVTQQSSSASDETVNVRTLTNRNQNYSYSYPENWEVKNSPKDVSIIFGCDEADQSYFVGLKGVNKTGFDVCVFLPETNFEEEATKEASKFELVYRKKIIVGGRQAIELKFIDPDAPEVPIYQAYVENTIEGKTGTLILVGFNGDGKYSDDEFQKIFDQILSTFQFID